MHDFHDTEWRKDYLNTKRRVSKRERDLLENGPKSFMQSLLLGVIHQRYLKMKGLWTPTPPPPDVSSNLKDSLQKWEKDYG